jgi:cytochrome c-type biogenesis protein CcmF
VAVRDTFFINDYVAILDDVKGIREVDGIALNEGDAAAQATVRILDKDANLTIQPTFVIKNREVWSKPEVNDELGLRIQLNKIDPNSGKFSFTTSRTQREYIVMKALEKPQINLLWIGTLMVIFGMFLTIFRRFKEEFFTK